MPDFDLARKQVVCALYCLNHKLAANCANYANSLA